MGCGQGKTIEGQGKENKGFPVCRATIDLTKLVNSMIAYDENKIGYFTSISNTLY